MLYVLCFHWRLTKASPSAFFTLNAPLNQKAFCFLLLIISCRSLPTLPLFASKWCYYLQRSSAIDVVSSWETFFWFTVLQNTPKCREQIYITSWHVLATMTSHLFCKHDRRILRQLLISTLLPFQIPSHSLALIHKLFCSLQTVLLLNIHNVIRIVLPSFDNLCHESTPYEPKGP